MSKWYWFSRIFTLVALLTLSVAFSWWWIVTLPVFLWFNEKGIREYKKYE